MFFKKKRTQVMDAWGELCDEAPARTPAGKAAIERADGLPVDQRRRRYAMMAIAAFALVAFCLVAGTCAAMSSTVERSEQDSASSQQADAAQSQGTDAAQSQSATSKYANISKWDFLSDDSKAEFAARFDQYAEEQGLGDGPAMCYSRVDADAGVYTAWLSYPAGERFFKVTFTAADKGFAFEECAMPDGLPEINYSAEQAKGAQDDSAPAEQAAPAAAEYPSQPDSSYVSVDRSEQEAAASQAHQWVDCTSASALSGFLDANAAAMLPDSATGWLSSKGYSANAADCQVDLASVSGTASLMGFSMKCATTSGEVTLDCEWNASAGQFGFAIAK